MIAHFANIQWFKMLKNCFVFLLISQCVFCDYTRRSWSRSIERPIKNPRFIDIYTNHDDFKEVLKHYTEFKRRPNDRVIGDEDFTDGVQKPNNDNLESEFGEIVDLKPNDLMVINTNKYVVQKPPSLYDNYQNDVTNFHTENIAHQDDNKNLEDEEDNKVPVNTYIDKRPKFQTQKYNWTDPERLTRFSYVQKIPKLPGHNYNSVEKNSTKSQINDMLKNYLTKLYSQKYNNTAKFYTTANVYKVPKFDTEPNKSKFLDDAISGIKNKTMKIANKFFSLFQVVQFSNSKCTATSAAGDYLGTCYHELDCTRLNGTAMGNCANGYGVCCVFKNTCGGSSNKNCTYFESPNYPNYYPSNGSDIVIPTTQSPTTQNPSPTPDPRLKYYYSRQIEARQQTDVLSCIFRLYKQNSNITQMRIDFIDLELRGPTNGTCIQERLVITGQNINNQVPVLCGYNTGQHIYVDVSMLTGPLQLSVLSTIVSRKRWKIRICQYENSCTTSNCLQYYTGASGVITSFNYDQSAMFSRSTPQYLNNLNYAICIRKEAGYCSITYSNVMNGVEYPFQMNNRDDAGNRTVPAGQAGADVINCPDDYIILDGSRLCGDKLNDGSVNDNFTQNAPVTDSSSGPIVIPVRTDSSVTGLGFKIFYRQNRCTTL